MPSKYPGYFSLYFNKISIFLTLQHESCGAQCCGFLIRNYNGHYSGGDLIKDTYFNNIYERGILIGQYYETKKLIKDNTPNNGQS